MRRVSLSDGRLVNDFRRAFAPVMPRKGKKLKGLDGRDRLVKAARNKLGGHGFPRFKTAMKAAAKKGAKAASHNDPGWFRKR